jgi:hypothetical protein
MTADAQELIHGGSISSRNVANTYFIKFHNPPLSLVVVLGSAVALKVFVIIGPINRDKR